MAARSCQNASDLSGKELFLKDHDARIITIPSSDAAFRRQVAHMLDDTAAASPEGLESRLRRMFPRAVVRRRDISGERTAWYVYRDGGWRADMIGPWWRAAGLPRLIIARDGWIVEADAIALGVLGIEAGELGIRHFTDFVAPGTLDDAMTMFAIVDDGHDLTATILIRPSTGDVLAVDIHATRDGDAVAVLMRLADDVEPPPPVPMAVPTPIHTEPTNDAAFRGYVERQLSRMPEPTTDGLALRLRRLYPHAHVSAATDGWTAHRDALDEARSGGAWWSEGDVPRVRYDAQALIVDANDAARALLGHELLGHHWQEFVTPGSTEQVSAMLAILADLGRAESRFRMPRADGSLLEFDSYTEVDDDGFTTFMRARP